MVIQLEYHFIFAIESAVAKVVLHDLDKLFQGHIFQMLISRKR